jgi:DNA-binding transcriptional regulator YiaG
MTDSGATPNHAANRWRCADLILRKTLSTIAKVPLIMEEFPEQLKAWRKRRGYTQKNASTLLGIPIRTLQQWEERRRTPTPFVQRTLWWKFWEL